MKVIVADKISERGVKLLKEQDGWTTVLTTKETLEAEITDADALIVRSATKVTEHLLARAPKLRAVGRAGVGVDNINLEAATKRGVLITSTPRKLRERGRAYLRFASVACAAGAAAGQSYPRGALGKILRSGNRSARENARACGPRKNRERSGRARGGV